MKKLLIFLIRTYQLTISPRFSNGACRYVPTCSQYALEAIEIHGIFKGTLLAIRRILRCNPFFKGGYDPVPPKKINNEENK
ncbi:MAG: membrane protein insertion efficiency factor YidD [Eubacterium sp.]